MPKIKIFLTMILLSICAVSLSFAEVAKQPMTVNGDTVEFLSEGREVMAEGNVEVVSSDSTLSCDKVRVFIDEKLAIAEGNVKIVKKDGEKLEGELVVFDFGTKTGTIVEPKIRMFPYYGKASLMEKISGEEFFMENTELSTCDLPHPHYTLRCSEVKMNPGSNMTAKDVRFSVLDVPTLYLPSFSQRMTDKKPRFMILPGRNKKLGTYFLGSYRYYLGENVKGQLHLDWYQDRGTMEGIDLNYDTKAFGLGNAKYYRIGELWNNNKNPVPKDERKREERSKTEVRHKWDITENDHAVLEYFKQSDQNFRKDYFFREYEKDTNPKTLLLLSHIYPNATLSFLEQPRINRFDSVVQKIPELKLETVNQRIQDTPFYYKNSTALANMSGASADVAATTDVLRMDSFNQFSYLFRFMSLDFNPFVAHQDTYYSRGVDDVNRDFVRGMFSSGMDVSTKFFKTFDVETSYMNLDIDKLRHIVTPSMQYRYQHSPTVNKSLIQQLDGVDGLDMQDKIIYALENKLQTKRSGETVDLARLILSSDYNIERIGTTKRGFLSFKHDLEFKPYSWWELDNDAEFDTVTHYYKNINTDLWADIGKLRASFGHRFKYKESSQMTTGFSCPLNPFWKANVYERFEFNTGKLMEQEYTLDRDMHCWTMQFIVNHRAKEGTSFMLAFKLKAFPDMGINASASFNPPRTVQE